jgi:mannose-1-phosphate guanylyltransferase/mannose-6-phosphate isomerase
VGGLAQRTTLSRKEFIVFNFSQFVYKIIRMKIVVLSGGSGSRLWPISRESYPKQFCEFFDKSFLRDTIERLMPLGPVQIVTLESMSALTRSALVGLNVDNEDIILEPLPKNTAAAIGLVTHLAVLNHNENEVMGVFPADHLISDVKRFQSVVRLAEEMAGNNHVVTLGIEPRYAATGYGYLEIEKEPLSTTKEKLSAYKVKQFFEKPSAEKAEAYLSSRRHFWNAGIFFFKVSQLVKLYETHMPDMWRKLVTIKKDLSNLKSVYSNLVSQSIDYGLMEKLHGQIVCVPAAFGWSDVGSWDELARLQEEKIKIESKANVYQFDSTENFVYSNHNKVVGLCGVDRLIVVDTPDALLVARRGESENVKKLVETMRTAHLPQASEHNFEVRPWGRFEILADQPDHKVKRLIVDAGAQLSYQMHQKRDEHWTIIAGQAEVTINETLHSLKSGQHIFVARGQKHRIRNTGKEPLVFIEVQTGQYFGEDDIQRFADDYNRI